MFRVVGGILLVWLVIFVVPFIVYGSLSSVWGLKIPEGASPLSFLLSVLVSKAGTAITFVLIFYFTREVFGSRWLLYAGLWWVMFALGEVGQVLGANYSWKEATVGIVSETVYLPLSAFLLSRIYQ